MKNLKTTLKQIEWPKFKHVVITTLSIFSISVILCLMLGGWNYIIDLCVEFVLSLC